MYTKVSLLLDENETIESFMQIYVTGSDITITYFDEHASVIVSDKLSGFQILDMSKTSERKATFQGAITNRSIIFHNETDKSTFLEVLNENSHLSPIPEKNACFKIEPKQSASVGLFGFVADVVKNLSPASPNRKPIVRRQVDAFTYGTVVPCIPEKRNFTVIDAKAAETIDLETIQFASDVVEDAAFPIIFDRILLNKSPENAKESYIPLSKQWNSLTKSEWGQNALLRVFVHDTERQVVAVKGSDEYKKLHFNLAMSLFTLYFGSIKFDEELWFEIATLTAVYIKDSENGDHLETIDGKKIETIDAEVMVFWPLVELHKKMVSAKLSVPQESLKVRSMLESISYSTVQMLDDRGYKSLDFATPEAKILFTRWREPHVAASTLASALTSGNIASTRQSMLCAAIVLLHEKLQEIPIEYPQNFTETFSLGLRGLDGKILLYNAEKMMSSTHHSVQKK